MLDHIELVKARQEEQTKLATKKGKKSADEFAMNDTVIIQDNRTRRWMEQGTISGERKADDNTIQSFEITLRNKRDSIMKDYRQQ